MLRPLRLLPVLGAVALAPVLPASLMGQDASLAVEVLGGASVPVASFNLGTAVGEGTSFGPSFGVLLTLTGVGRRTTYVGFSQHRFGCVDAGCPQDGEYVATGMNAGFRFTLVRSGPVRPWLSVGGFTTRVESPGVHGMHTGAGSPSSDSPAGVSSLGYGAEAGVGLYIGAGRAVALDPQVRFATVGVDLPGEQRLTLRTVVASLALVLAF